MLANVDRSLTARFSTIKESPVGSTTPGRSITSAVRAFAGGSSTGLLARAALPVALPSNHSRELFQRHFDVMRYRRDFESFCRAVGAPFDEDLRSVNLDAVVSSEIAFGTRVLDAYAAWHREPHPVVLWDIDLTMGGVPGGGIITEQIRSQRGYVWGFRAALLPLLQLLHDQFPLITNGILSTRSLHHILAMLEDPRQLSAVAPFFNRQYLYSTDGFQEAKAAMLQELRCGCRMNVKIIDDEPSLSRDQAARGQGVFIGDCCVFERGLVPALL